MRHGYLDDFATSQEEQWANIRWRGAVKSSIRGKRGQAFLKGLLTALDAMEPKRLITNHLEADGQFCTLGLALKIKGIDPAPIMELLGEDDGYICGEDAYWEALSDELNISGAMVQEIMYHNDECIWDSVKRKDETQERFNERIEFARWSAMRNWVAGKIAMSGDEE